MSFLAADYAKDIGNEKIASLGLSLLPNCVNYKSNNFKFRVLKQLFMV